MLSKIHKQMTVYWLEWSTLILRNLGLSHIIINLHLNQKFRLKGCTRDTESPIIVWFSIMSLKWFLQIMEMIMRSSENNFFKMSKKALMNPILAVNIINRSHLKAQTTQRASKRSLSRKKPNLSTIKIFQYNG